MSSREKPNPALPAFEGDYPIPGCDAFIVLADSGRVLVDGEMSFDELRTLLLMYAQHLGVASIAPDAALQQWIRDGRQALANQSIALTQQPYIPGADATPGRVQEYGECLRGRVVSGLSVDVAGGIIMQFKDGSTLTTRDGAGDLLELRLEVPLD